MNPKDPLKSSSLSLAPYEIKSEGDALTFTTDSQLVYRITFIDDSHYTRKFPFQGAVYSFVLELVQGELSGSDPRVGRTVIEVINAFFEDEPEGVVLYTCSQADRQEQARHILFERWFRHFGKDGFQKIDYSDQTKREHASAIFRAENADRVGIEATFNSIFKEK